MYWVYILYSNTLSKFYVGSTQHLDIRLLEHNRGKSPFTKQGIPWQMIYSKACIDRSEAILLEMKIKKRGIQRYLADLKINSAG